MEKSCRKCALTASDPFLILVTNPKQPLHARSSFENKIFWKRLIKKPEKVNFIFSFEPSPSWWTKLSKIKGALY